MTPLYISIEGDDSEGLKLQAECMIGRERRSANSVADLPSREVLEVLLDQVATGLTTSTAHQRLAAILGGVLFTGEVGTLLRDALSSESTGTIFLKTPTEHAHWPWELSRDEQTGIRPAIDAGLVRVGGRSSGARTIPPRGLLVVPRAAGAAKRTALQAATRNLSKSQDIDIYPADPVTGPGMRRALETGAILVHLDMHDSHAALLDDGRVPIDRLGIGEEVWLAVLGGTQITQEAGGRLRESGATMVLSHQSEMSPAQAAAIEREFYRSLAHGDSVTDAITRARFSLFQAEGEGSHAWAAPVLWSAPGQGHNEPAMMPFPPENMAATTSAGVDAKAPSADSRPFADLSERVGHPLSAAVFIRDTVRKLRHGSASSEELSLRATALRELGAGRPSGLESDRALGPDDRVQQLADRLVDVVSRPDARLEAPGDLAVRTTQGAIRLGMRPEKVREAALALLASRIVFLEGPAGSGARELGRLLAEEVYGYHPRQVNAQGQGPFRGGPERAASGGLTAGGWLYRTVASNWRRDELDPLQPEQPDPVTRVPLVGRASTQWRVYNGSWLVVDNAESMDETPATIRALSHACGRGVIEGINDESWPYRLPLPHDFRVILIGEWAPSGLPLDVPRITVPMGADDDAERNRWLAIVNQQLGPARDQAEAGARRQMADRLIGMLELGRVACELPGAVGAAALAYAISRGGLIDDAVCEAFQVYVGPHLRHLPPRAKDLLRSGLAGKRTAFFEAASQLAADGETRCLEQLAQLLDRRENAGSDNQARLRALSDDPVRLGEWLRLKDSTSAYRLPSVGARAVDLVGG